MGDIQAKYEEKLTDASRRAISRVLSQVQAERTIQVHDKVAGKAGRSMNHSHIASSLLQRKQPLANSTPTPVPPEVSPVVGSEGSACLSTGGAECMKACPPTPPDCGLLHDKLSLLWGDYKDKVDMLQMQMNKNEYEFEELKMMFNDQIRVLTTSK